MNNTETKTKQNGSVLGWLEQVITMWNKYGLFKMIFGIIFLLFMALATYVIFNPGTIFEKYNEYIETIHNESLEYRLNSSPLVQMNLDNLVTESGAIRAYVIEMHNGKNNPTGLSFIYGSLNYESVCDTACSVMEDYDDFSLERFPLISKIYNEGYWGGTVNEMMNIDHRFALRVASNDARYVAMCVIYGVKEEIGFLGISYGGNKDINSGDVKKLLEKYAAKLSPLLDGHREK